jgi:hypothetical protein
LYVARIIGELENWRLEVEREREERVVEVRKTGVKLKRVVSEVWVWSLVDVVRVRRRGVVAGRWTRVRRARRAIGESNCGMLAGVGDLQLLSGMESRILMELSCVT